MVATALTEHGSYSVCKVMKGWNMFVYHEIRLIILTVDWMMSDYDIITITLIGVIISTRSLMVFDSERHSIGQTVFGCHNQPMNFSPDTSWILSFLFTARLSGVSKVSLDRFQIVLCLSVCPWAPKGESGIVKEEKKSHSISWTDHWSGWLWHVMTQTASFLPLLSRRWPYKWCCRLPPYAIKHGVKQDGVLSPLIRAAAPSAVFAPRSHLSEKKSRLQRQFSLWWFCPYTVFFLLFLPCLCFIASCECWSEARSWSFPNRCLGAYRPRLCPYLWPSASCILSLACLRVGIYFT